MLKKAIKYVDYDGNERNETFYFYINKAELMEMELSTSGGLAEHINRIVAAQDAPSIIKVFKDLILKAYGEKSPDGKRFVKVAPDGHRLADDFAQTEAYSILFMELATNTEAATEFINGIVPNDMNPAARAIAPAAK